MNCTANEDGLNVLGESMQLDFGSPEQIERAMVTAKRLEWLTGINEAGHRHVRSSYFSGAKMAEGGVWDGRKKPPTWSSIPRFAGALQRLAGNAQDDP